MKNIKLISLRKILKDRESRKNNVRSSLVGWYDVINVVLLVFIIGKILSIW